jgi:hypothetical protein
LVRTFSAVSARGGRIRNLHRDSRLQLIQRYWAKRSAGSGRIGHGGATDQIDVGSSELWVAFGELREIMALREDRKVDSW